MNELAIQEVSNSDMIRSRIFTIRGVQVMLDRDLAELYGIATKALNQAVKRNIERFPERYMFQLSKEDISNMRSQFATGSGGELLLRSQNVTLNINAPNSNLRSQIVTSRWGGTRYLPYAFTEHGIIMLASVLNSPTAVEASVRITDTFVAMRKALASIAPLLDRIETAERRQIADQAKNELIVIDPYFADCVLPLIAQKHTGVQVVVVKNSRSKLLHDVDVAQFNAQYNNSLEVKVSDNFHDRFLIIDKTTLIHVGVSLNHLGKKCFAFSSLDKSNIPDIIAKI